MPIRVELYGAAGVAIGIVARPRLRDALEGDREVLVESAAWHPLDGSAAQPRRELSVAGDDILVAISDDTEDGPVHAQWHDIALDVGPYRVSGQMPTMPGFDPGRALARPTGEFVLIRDVRIALLGDSDGPAIEQRSAFVNRYVVDRVAADLMLGFFFPGAEMVLTGGHQQSSAGASLTPAATLASGAPGSSPAADPSPAPALPAS
jgi:hypothetical protein